jgi:hypothetical protein
MLATMEGQMMKKGEATVMRGSWLRGATMMVSAGILALSGCYIFSPSQAQVDKAQTQLHFNLAQCQQTAPNLYNVRASTDRFAGLSTRGSRSIACLWIKTATCW